MTFNKESREEMLLGFQSFQRCGLANFFNIQLTVAEVLAKTLIQGFKQAAHKRDLNVGQIHFERILANYLIVMLLTGILEM